MIFSAGTLLGLYEILSPLGTAGEPGSGAYQAPLMRALVHAVCSEMDETIEYVQRAIDEYDPLLWYLAVHPLFDALRDDPQYPDLLRRMNLEGTQP